MKVALVLAAFFSTATAFFGAKVQHVSTSSARAPMREGVFMRKRPVSVMKGKRKVVLTTDLKNLGASNDVVTVRDGYYLNYLLPRGFAGPADDEALAKVSAAIIAKEEKEKVRPVTTALGDP